MVHQLLLFVPIVKWKQNKMISEVIHNNLVNVNF